MKYTKKQVAMLVVAAVVAVVGIGHRAFDRPEDLFDLRHATLHPGSIHGRIDYFDGEHWLVVHEGGGIPRSLRGEVIGALLPGTRGAYAYDSLRDFAADGARWHKINLEVNSFGVVLMGKGAEALAQLPETPYRLIVMNPQGPAPAGRLEWPAKFQVMLWGAETPAEIERSWREYAARNGGGVTRTELAAVPAEFEKVLAAMRYVREPTREELEAFLKKAAETRPEAAR